jgi:beta-lactamase class C
MQQSNLEQEIYSLMGDYLDNNYTPGVAVAAYQSGAAPIVLARGFAVLKPDQNVEVTTKTVFELGSVTKVFTATLMAFNFSALNDPITKHLPYTIANPALANITLQQLATHTSGFPKDVTEKDFSGPGKDGATYLFQDQKPPEDSALFNFWNKWNPTDYSNECSSCPVGTCWQYSNVGFVTLGYAAAGLNYTSMLQEKITGPKVLNMPATGANVSASFPKAQGYVRNKQGEIELAKGEAADLKSNAEDMYNWLKAQFSPPASLENAINIAQDTFFRASEQCVGSQKPTVYDMGLGWQMRPLNKTSDSQRLFLKDGASGLGGQSCWIGYVFNPNAGVVVLTNGVGAQKKPASLGLQILGKLLDQTINIGVEEQE